MASSIQLNSTNNSEMKIQYQGTSGVPKTVVVPDRDMTVGSEITLGTAVTASGTSVDFTGIPSGVKRVTVMFNGVSTNGTSPYQIQLGTSAGVETSGYNGSCANIDNASAITGAIMASGFRLASGTSATVVFNGKAELSLLSGNLWTEGAILGRTDYAGSQFLSSGTKTLSGALDRIRITTVNGTDTFDAGTINISWEF